MIRRVSIALAIVLAVVGAIAFLGGTARWIPEPAAPQKQAAQPAPPTSGTIRRTLSNLDRSQLALPTSSPRPYESPLRRQFLEAKDFHALYRSLDGRTDPDALFMRANLLERCKGWESTAKQLPKEVRTRDSMNRLTGKYLELRREIIKVRSAHTLQDSCANFPTAITQQEIEDAYTRAADAGDPRGKLVQLHRALLGGAERRETAVDGVPFAPVSVTTMITPTTLTESEASLLKAALASRDPAQILYAGPMLSATYKEYELKFGDGKGLEGIFDGFLWTSVACHFGGGCGPDSQPVIEDCVINARCDVESYEDKLRKYILTPEQWPRFLEYRQTLIQAIDTQDWSLLQERRGPRTNISGSVFPVETRSPRFRLRFP